ncbi:ABC transporter permease [Sinorhizobium numidicum]|uniref:ABC transporter permease n=1 Tax=Sinorhizobium numidicum TaxID=680248 RepID=A0ABY8CUB7_9HYPH|nr:ABC transporter permease [Sinorhizobium numidicum]WEX75495.1 ABC transporter permease [Sinorhizobium numidicum]WEX81492.1 ABC transporter permease [Sinorhizobium numidicum]
MTFFKLARKNAWRKPIRTMLVMFCVAVAFLVYGLTASFLDGTQGSAGASDDILGVMNSAGRTQPLPMAHMTRIAATPDVAAVAYMARMRGFVDVERNVVAISAADPALLAAVNGKELGLTSPLLDAIGEARDRVLVGRALARTQGWSVGQRVAVAAFQTVREDGSRNWSFEVAGIFEGESASTDTYFMIARYDYVNAARARGKDTVDAFIVRPRATVSPGLLAARIDALFANSAAATKTQSEKQFLEAFLRQYADTGLIVGLVVGAAFVTILMIVINTMVFAVRERTFEIGLLKTLGFSRLRIMTLVLGETLFIFAVGGFAGLAVAKLATLLAGPTLGLVFSGLVLAKATAIIIALGLATGALPAFNAMRTPIVTAFRTR